MGTVTEWSRVVVPTLPTMTGVAAGLLGFVEANTGSLFRKLQAWSHGLRYKSDDRDTRPWVTDRWIWLPTADPALGETAETGRYYLHCGTGRIFDVFSGGWCGSNWAPRKNTPRVSVAFRRPHLDWTQLGKLLAYTADAPQGGPGSGDASRRWTIAAESGHAEQLRHHEVANGFGTGCLDVLRSFRWVRVGRPRITDVTEHPYEPRHEFQVNGPPDPSGDLPVGHSPPWTH